MAQVSAREVSVINGAIGRERQPPRTRVRGGQRVLTDLPSLASTESVYATDNNLLSPALAREMT